jgi:glutamine cyclotransferase
MHKTVLLLGIMMLTGCRKSQDAAKQNVTGQQAVSSYDFRLANRYNHDADAQTQGLVFRGGFLYEGTGPGRKSPSSLRKVDIKTGNVLQRHNLSGALWGEGITILNDKIYQLTYVTGIGFIYRLDDFSRLGTFHYSTQGWGLTDDGTNLIMSDGSSHLYVLDPNTFRIVEHIDVTDDNGPVEQLNELEFIDGAIYANIHETGRIVCINRYTGKVFRTIDLHEILSGLFEDDGYISLANGIACDHQSKKLYITGKFWPYLFDLDMVRR